MIIAVLPPIEFAFLWFIRYLLRAYDQKKCCCPVNYPFKTRKKSIEAYKKLYAGPEFDMDYMQAQTFILSILAFIFGPLLPQLFIYGLLGMVLLDQTVRLRIAYSARRFP